jgi:hypothetical protein
MEIGYQLEKNATYDFYYLSAIYEDDLMMWEITFEEHHEEVNRRPTT